VTPRAAASRAQAAIERAEKIAESLPHDVDAGAPFLACAERWMTLANTLVGLDISDSASGVTGPPDRLEDGR
jgi:hypothetical protein